jgi:tRNA-dihydrouridine synthase B
MQLGSHTLSPTPDGFVTALAPMANITNPPFRTVAREHGCGMTVTEMVSAEFLVRDVREGREGQGLAALRTERAPGEDFYVVQLFGGDADTMAEAARIVEAAGADVIDINMGCPVRKITGRCSAGVALMREPERAGAIVRAMTDAVRVPVTAKIRAGWDEQHANAPEFARRLEDAGAALIAVHARTRTMVHQGDPRLSIVRAVKEAVSVPVFGNGGVASLADARRMHRETGCDGVMIGRGAHGNPWLFRALAQGEEQPPTVDERFAVMLRHFELYLEWCGEARTAREMRKHLAWYASHLPGGESLRTELHRMDSTAAMREAIERQRDRHPHTSAGSAAAH